MKKSIILFGGLLFLTTQSCDVLDKEPLDSISTQQYFANANAQALEQYCNDLYPKLITGHGNPNEYNFGMMETDFQSDDLLPWDANSVAFSQHSISTADNDNWKWENIRACNAFMQDYELSPETEAVKHRYAGEILFFKTLDYFNKVKRFGDVPWYDKVLVPGDEDLYKGRDSRITVVANMIKDIDQAIEWLPQKETTGVYRISKDAALALKARICLFEGTFRRYHNMEGDTELLKAAYEAAGELMKSEYGYSLFQGSKPGKAYYELFIQADYNSNPEIILSKEYDPTVGKGNNLSRQIAVGESPIGLSRDAVEDYLCATTGKPISMCGCEGHSHHTTLIAELKNRDPRLLQTVPTPEAGEYTYYLEGKRPDIGKYTSGSVSTSTGYGVIKYYNPSEYTSSHHIGTLDAPIFRYAEILLNYAEAMDAWKGADYTDNDHALSARAALNQVRSAADMPAVTTDGDAFTESIRRERRVELAFEDHRFWDIRRWKIGDKTKAIYCIKITLENGSPVYKKELLETRNWDDKMYLYPIPQTEYYKNPNLGQNTGW